MPSTAFAQDDDFSRRLALADQMLELRPASTQLEKALDLYIQNYMLNQSEENKTFFRDTILKILNPKALEKVAQDAYAETFTTAELEAMVEYYSKPEARSASEKQPRFNAMVTPEIIRMLDQAVMRFKTEAQNP